MEVVCPCGGPCAAKHAGVHDSAYKWNTPGWPPNGWTYTGHFKDHEEHGEVKCEMCNTPLRYEHFVTHPVLGKHGVGCKCASIMIRQGAATNDTGFAPDDIQDVATLPISVNMWAKKSNAGKGTVSYSATLRKGTKFFKLFVREHCGGNETSLIVRVFLTLGTSNAKPARRGSAPAPGKKWAKAGCGYARGGGRMAYLEMDKPFLVRDDGNLAAMKAACCERVRDAVAAVLTPDEDEA